MASQVTGYRYFTNLLLFIGNPIEKVLGINFDKRGWINPLVDENGNALEKAVVAKQYLYGETEGGIGGAIHARYGTNNQDIVTPYKNYMESMGLQASAYPFQSYLAFTGLNVPVASEPPQNIDQSEMLPFGANNAFYVGNSGYMKEMLLWPKRIHVRNDGRGQWYDTKSEIAKNIEGSGDESIYQSGKEYILNGLYDGEIKNKYGVITNLYDEPIKSGIRESFGDNPQAGDSGYYIINDFCSPPAYVALVVGSYHSDVNVVFSDGVIILGVRDIYSPNGYFHREWGLILTGLYQIKIIVTAKEAGFQQLNLYADFFSNDEYPANTWSIPSGDINPIHKIREILTDDTAMHKPESSVNNENFIKAADQIYDEALGISWSITEKSCMDAINELCYHIEAGIRVNRQTGLYEMVLFRDDWFDEDEIHIISESKIKSMSYEITNADEVINQVNVNYYDRENIKNSSFSISESGLIQTLNRVNAETVDFPYFMNMRNAEIVANWKLKLLSTGVYKGTFTTGWREARKWNRYDLIRLPWSKRWTGTILVRIMSINLGRPTNNEVSIEFVEVVPATGMMNTTIVADDPMDTKPQPPQPSTAKVFELTYFEAVQAFSEREVNAELSDNPEVGYLCAIAEKPQNNSLNAALHVDSGNGFERVATVNYCETAYLDQAIDRMSSSFTIKNVGNITSVRVGSQIFINDEIMVYQSYDAETKVLTVKRGAFDLIPQNHATDSILYFADDFVAVDRTLYVYGEVMNAKVLTTTPSGVLALSDALTYEVIFNSRAIRPYPPANVKINGEYWLDEIETDLVLTWVDRNRSQQTGGEIIGWFEGSVTIEPGTLTYLILTEYDLSQTILATNNVNVTGSSSYTMPASSMQANTRTIEIVLKTIRDGHECFQPFVHMVELSLFFTAPYNLIVEYLE